MDNVDLQVLRTVQQWRSQGYRVVLGTVTRTWGSAPRPIGSLVAVRVDGPGGPGQIAGSVSGGCIEDDLIDKVRAGALAATSPQVTRYGIGAEAAQQFGLPCGGLIEIVLEPVGPQSRIDELLAALADGRLTRRRLDLKTGAVSLESPDAADELQIDDRELVTTHGPRWRLLLIGAGQMSAYLAQMAQALDYEVIVCDPREEYTAEWNVPGARIARSMPDDLVQEIRPDGHTAIIALTHDPKLDDLALMEALKSPAFYVGAIGSRLNQGKRKERLKEHFDVPESQLERLHGPVGLKNGARTPPEIAVSILAELTAVRYGYHIPAPIAVSAGVAPAAGCVA